MLALALGAAVGILGPLLGAAGTAAGHMASLVLSAGWAWAALAFCVGLARESRLASAVLGVASLVVAVVAYYATKLGQGEFRASDISDRSGGTIYVNWHGFLSMTAIWCVVACVLGALLGLAGNLARNRGVRGLPFRLVVPLVAIVETSQRLHFEAEMQGSAVVTTWTVIRVLAGAGILVLVVMTWLAARSPR
jgi:hypothetical protein